MDKDSIIKSLQNFACSFLDEVISAYSDREEEFAKERYEKWRRRFSLFLDQHLPGESKRLSDKLIRPGISLIRNETAAQRFNRYYGKKILAFIESLIEDFQKDQYHSSETPCHDDSNIRNSEDPIQTLEKYFCRFTYVVRALRKRHDKRPTLDVSDEYDVQDLLYALLHIEFDDIRPEQWTPSYAGKSSRVDFLLKNEQFVIEVKMTRKGLADKELGDQLIIDIERYQKHPDCKKLYCFVFDPEARIVNKPAIKNDLESHNRNDFEVKIFIYPE